MRKPTAETEALRLIEPVVARIQSLESTVTGCIHSLTHIEERMHAIETEFANLRDASLAAGENLQASIREAVTERLAPLMTAVEELRICQQELADAMREFLQTELTSRAEAIAESAAPRISQRVIDKP